MSSFSYLLLKRYLALLQYKFCSHCVFEKSNLFMGADIVSLHRSYACAVAP
jgi:hypothetical protein